MHARKRLIAVAAVIGLLAGGCASVSGPDPVGTLTPLGGRVEILSGTEWELVTEQTELAPGDQVRSGADGAATLQVSDTGTIEVGPSSRVRMGSAGASELMSGSVLAQGSDLAVTIGRVAIRAGAPGAFRVDRALSTRVGTYRGTAAVTALGGSVDVRALRQAFLVAHSVLAKPAPLRIDPRDAWDRRMLGDAVEIGLDLARLERGVGARLSQQGNLAETFARVLPGSVSPGRIRSLIQDHPVGSARLFLSLAVASEAPVAGDVIPTAREILRTLGQGATWIVVVAALDVARNSLLQAIGSLIAAIPGLVPANGSTSIPIGGSGSPDPGPSGGPGPTPPPTSPPADPCADGQAEGCPGEDDCAQDDAACEAVDEIVDGVVAPNGEERDGDLPPPLGL